MTGALVALFFAIIAALGAACALVFILPWRGGL